MFDYKLEKIKGNILSGDGLIVVEREGAKLKSFIQSDRIKLLEEVIKKSDMEFSDDAMMRLVEIINDLISKIKDN